MRMLARIMGIGIETADMLVHEALSRKLRDQGARYAGLRKAMIVALARKLLIALWRSGQR